MRGSAVFPNLDLDLMDSLYPQRSACASRLAGVDTRKMTERRDRKDALLEAGLTLAFRALAAADPCSA